MDVTKEKNIVNANNINKIKNGKTKVGKKNYRLNTQKEKKCQSWYPIKKQDLFDVEVQRHLVDAKPVFL